MFPRHTLHFPVMVANITDYNLNKNYQILIIIGTNIPDTTGHQMTIADFRWSGKLNGCLMTSYVRNICIKKLLKS